MADERKVDIELDRLADAPAPETADAGLTDAVDLPVPQSAEAAEVLEVPVAMTPAEIDERAQVVEALRQTSSRQPLSRDDTLGEPPVAD